MEACKNNHLASGTEPLVLRWSDRFDTALHEEVVEVVLWNSSNPVIRTLFCLAEKTQVYLSGSNYTGTGIVFSCRREDSGYLLTLSMTADNVFMPPRQQFDPGLLAVDDFLTEEEEAKILESLRDEMPCSALMRITSCLQLVWHFPRRAFSLLIPHYSV